MKAVVRKTARVQHRSAPRGNERRLVTQHPRRQVLSLAAGAAALPAVSRISWAQAYPTRPVRVIVPFAAGRGADILARLIGQWLSERLGRPFIVENRPGGAGNIGTGAVAHALSNDVAALHESVGSQGRDAGRLYAPPGECAECDQRDALRQSQFQFRPRHRACREHHARAPFHGGTSIVSG